MLRSLDPHSFTIVLKLTGTHKVPGDPVLINVVANNPEDLAGKVGLEVLHQLDPYLNAFYAYHFSGASADFPQRGGGDQFIQAVQGTMPKPSRWTVEKRYEVAAEGVVVAAAVVAGVVVNDADCNGCHAGPLPGSALS